MGTTYGVGIIGAGTVAAEYVQAFRDHPLTYVAGIYNRTPGKASDLLRKHHIDGQAYASLEALLDDERIQVVVSCTHAHLRREHCVRAAATGRHIVIEKPIGLTLADSLAIREAVAKAGVKTVTSFVLRWNPQIETVRRLIDDGVVGALVYAEADYWHPFRSSESPYLTLAQARSAFVVAGCHAVDVLRFLGDEIVEVSAFSAAPRINPAFEYPPVIAAIVRFANGAIGKLSAVLDADTPYNFKCRLFGTEATIQNNRVFSSKHYPGALDYWTFPTIRPDSGDVAHHPFRKQIAHFIECIEQNVESHASIYDTFKTMAVCFAIDESAAAGGQPYKVQNETA